MKETGAPEGETTVGVTLRAEDLGWLAEAVAGRGGRLILEMKPGAMRRSARPEACPLTPAEQEAVRVVVQQDTWDAAAGALGVSARALRARLRTACRRLGIGSEGRLIALCLARGWAAPAEQ